ncbi:hypothetical protein [Leuconostoc pseudomesenteroides]|uniref:hypothetical protein n=1 Tax=Leuconostoc pseudomesenteroides TaxID=33968 RepID=UPI0039EC7BF9
MDYFETYLLVLTIISENHATDFDGIMRHLPSDQEISYSEIQDVVENLIDDQMIKGKSTFTKFGNIYLIERVTTTGYKFLQVARQPEFKQKLIDVIKQEGLPLTPANAVKFAANLIF